MSLRVRLAAALIAAAALAMGSCGTNGAAVAQAGIGADFSYAENRNWILSEIRSEAQTITLDRAGHAELFGDIFTLRFENGFASGTAMPNTFRGPHTLGADREITFGPMITTLMAAFAEPDEISEHEFLGLLYNAFEWSLVGETLELHTTDEDGAVVALVFVENN